MLSQEQDSATNEIVDRKRRLFPYSFTALTVLASVITVGPLLNQFQPAVTPPAPAPVLHPSAELTAAVPCAGSPSAANAIVLERADVDADVVGYIARVTVRQKFRNTSYQKVGAVYSFPLSNTAAVDGMTMKIGRRSIHGQIKKRDEALAVYKHALSVGKTAALLQQERTNIFTQSVANIEPNESIEVTLSYTDILKYENGHYSFVFPTQVGPRFTPYGSEPVHNGVSSYKNNLSLRVAVDGGMPIGPIASPLHVVDFHPTGQSGGRITATNISGGNDFILNWNVSDRRIKSGTVAERDREESYVTAMILPPKSVSATEAAPKELVLVVDCSGSQAGPPLEKAKETLHYIVDHMNPNDTFEIISFADETTGKLSPWPQPVSAKTKESAHTFIDSLTARGGTPMNLGIHDACINPAPGGRLRVVAFMTDGFVSNDYDMLALVRKWRANSRWFTFGTGNSVNRTLIDGIAREGGGEAEYVLLNSDGREVAKRFYERIANPVLTNVSVRVEGIPDAEVYPKQLSDVWERKPLYLHAKFSAKVGSVQSGTFVLSGYGAGGRKIEQRVPFTVGNSQSRPFHPIAQTWARAKVDDLMSRDWNGMQVHKTNSRLQNQIEKLALKHHLLTEWTSFVAVDNAGLAMTYDPTQPSEVIEEPSQPSNPVQASPLPASTTDSVADKGLFSGVVSQLNRLNVYQPSSTYSPPPAVPQESHTSESANTQDSNQMVLQWLALGFMWLTTLYLLFFKKKSAVPAPSTALR